MRLVAILSSAAVTVEAAVTAAPALSHKFAMASRRRDDEDYSYDRYNYHQDRTYSAANTYAPSHGAATVRTQPVPNVHSDDRNALAPTRDRCFQRVKAGAMMGGSIGLLAGLIFGTFSVIRYGAAPNVSHMRAQRNTDHDAAVAGLVDPAAARGCPPAMPWSCWASTWSRYA